MYGNTNTSPLISPSGALAVEAFGEVLVVYAPAGGGGGGTPGGSDTQVQFNDSGAFGGDAGLVYNKTTDALTGLGIFSASGFIATGETASTIASFDGGKKVTSLPTATYPSLTELSYLKGAYADMNDFIELSYLRSLYNLIYR